MGTILAYLPEPLCSARLKAAVEATKVLGRCSLTLTDSWDQLCGAARRVPAGLAVFDPYAGDALDLLRCAGFRDRFPSITPVPYADFTQRPLGDVLELGRLGIRVVVARDADDQPHRLAQILAAALPSSLERTVFGGLEELVPPELARVFRHVIAEAHRPLCPAEVARAYYRHPKTLREHLRRAGLPPTQKLIGWARLFHAAHALRDGGRGVEATAMILEFPSAAALRNQLARYAGLRAQELRGRDDAVAVVLHAFRARHARGDWESVRPLHAPGGGTGAAPEPAP